jgi:glutamate-1-semialdehyde aminotransferase
MLYRVRYAAGTFEGNRTTAVAGTRTLSAEGAPQAIAQVQEWVRHALNNQVLDESYEIVGGPDEEE